MTDESQPTPEQTRKLGRMLIVFGVLEVVFILGLSFVAKESWMPFLALLSLPTFFWGFKEIRKANDYEGPR